MELRYSAAEEALEWDSRKEVVGFVLTVDHSREFEHRGYFRSPIPTFPEAKVPFHQD